MKNFYLDLAKICFGVGFYGCVSKLDNPVIIIVTGTSSLIMVIVFVWIGSNQTEE